MKLFVLQVLEAELEGGSIRYKVHYNGWNSHDHSYNRWNDEWVRRDAIISLIEEPRSDSAGLKTKMAATVTTLSAKSEVRSRMFTRS
jgi:hypothetical protein